MSIDMNVLVAKGKSVFSSLFFYHVVSYHHMQRCSKVKPPFF